MYSVVVYVFNVAVFPKFVKPCIFIQHSQKGLKQKKCRVHQKYIPLNGVNRDSFQFSRLIVCARTGHDFLIFSDIYFYEWPQEWYIEWYSYIIRSEAR